MIEMLPLAAPEVVGENVTVTWADCPALMVLGVVIPLIPKALPVTVIMDTVRSAEPVLFNVRFTELFSPLDTVPKSMEAGVTDNCGGAAFTPVADRFATTGELFPSPATVSVPVRFPAAVGSTATVIVPDCPAASAIGKLAPVKLNWVFENVAWVMFTGTVPEFETETDCIVCLPTETLPKLIVAGFSWNKAWAVCFPVLVVIAAQPLKKIKGMSAIATKTEYSNVNL